MLAIEDSASFENRRLVYIGADTALLAEARLHRLLLLSTARDLLTYRRPPGRFKMVIMDPPWYEEHLLRFTWFASSALCIGGSLLLAMPPLGTRPGVQIEHQTVRTWLARLGLTVETVELGSLPYETPLFERNALRASGIFDVPRDWRRGDLWVVRKARRSSAPWPGDSLGSHWVEHRFGEIRVKIDTHAASQGPSARLVRLLEGDILPTVSRRDPRRAAARVWTTGNRVFGCESPAELDRILTDWMTGSNLSRVSASDRTAVLNQVRQLVALERIEIEQSFKSAPIELAVRAVG
jgi:hypothetical protein